jgi:hypothetical protein
MKPVSNEKPAEVEPLDEREAERRRYSRQHTWQSLLERPQVRPEAVRRHGGLHREETGVSAVRPPSPTRSGLLRETVRPRRRVGGKDGAQKVDLIISVGPSGRVYPANQYLRCARYVGAETVYINLEPVEDGNEASTERSLGRQRKYC